MVVRAVDLIMRCAVITHHVRDAALASEAPARIVLTNDNRAGFDALRAEGGVETLAEQEQHRVG